MGTIQLRQTKRHVLGTFLFVLSFCFVFTGMALAQVDQGSINGTVKDTNGAVIAHALVTLTNTDTNFMLQDMTGANGEYSFSPIKIGHYMVSATSPKFETTTQENITLNIQDRLQVNLTLKPGAVQETVMVTAAPPLLQNESASVGQVMTTETINNTPLNGRNWVYIAQLTAGVTPGFSNGANGSTIARGGGTGDFSANGQRTTQNNFILDGVDNNVNVDDEQNGASYNVRPPPDALAEFKIDTSDYSAEFGHSAGAVVNVSIKSGTNHIHGDLWEYIRNTAFDSADWDSAGGVVPNYHQNQFGATLGLPIWKNKLFYFGDAEENRIVLSAAGNVLSVPTDTERLGDLSEMFVPSLISNGTAVGIFAPNSDGCYPLTATTNPVNGATAAYPNPGPVNQGNLYALSGAQSNIIYPSFTCSGGATTNLLSAGNPPLASGAGPGGPLYPPVTGFPTGQGDGQFDTVASTILNDYPHANFNGGTSTTCSSATPGGCPLYNNYTVNSPSTDDTFQWDQRLDWNASSKDQAYARFSYTNEHKLFAPPLGPVINGGGLTNSGPVVNFGQNFMLSETHIFNPNLINEFRFGYNWGLFGVYQADASVPAETLIPGLGGVPFAGLGVANGGLPYLRIAGNGGITAGGPSPDAPSVERQNIYQILDNVTKVWRNHSFKFGIQLENIRTAFAQPSLGARGYYQYSGGFSGSPSSNSGSPIADFLMDDMGKLRLSNDPDTQYYRWYRAAYFQDDWKFNSKLTVNLGVRYDYVQPETNNAGDAANFVTTSQGINASGNAFGSGVYQMSSAVEGQNLLPASYVASLASNNVNVEYLNSKSMMISQKLNFAPRVGLAYQIDPKTVVRAGFGMFFGAIELPGGAELTVNYPWAYTAIIQNDFNGAYPAVSCFPNPYSGASNTHSACPGVGVPNPGPGVPATAAFDPAPSPFPISLEIGASNYLTGGLLASYAGTPTINRMDPNVKTPYTASYNLTVERQIGRNMTATLGYVGNFARHTWSYEPNYGGALGLTNGASSNQTYPFSSLSFYASSWTGEQMYNSLQGKLQKHYSNGLNFLATYTWSRAMDDGSNTGIGGGPGNFRNENIIPQKLEMTNAVFDVRHRVTLNGYYDLPFGKGRKWAHQGGAMDYIVGGWQTSLTWVAQTGNPFTVGPSGSYFSEASGGTVNAIRVGDPFKGGGVPPAGNIDMTDGGQSCPSQVKNRAFWFNPCAFTEPLSGLGVAQEVALGATPNGQNGNGIPWVNGTPYTQSNVVTGVAAAISYLGGKQNQIYGPGYERVNMSLFKNFKTWREQYFQFRADAFNLLNHPSWGQPADTSLDDAAGQIQSAQSFQNNTPDARFFQLSGKYVF